jgi:hypothetical protein
MTALFIEMAKDTALAHTHTLKRLPKNASELQHFTIPVWVVNAMSSVSGLGEIDDNQAIKVAAQSAEKGPRKSPYVPQTIRDAVNLQPAVWIVESIKRAALEPVATT